MATLTAVVVALAIAVAANFVLLLAIVRRMRLQPSAPPAIELPRIGMQAPGFSAEDADGLLVDDSFYAQHTDAVVAFLSDDCAPCQQVKAELAREPLANPLLAFVHTKDGGPRQHEFAADLARSGARTVLLAPGSDMPRRFSIAAFPTLLRLRDGVVIASSIRLAGIR